MSPRAAARLDALGFREVYDYKAGERDWFGEPPVTEEPADLTAGTAARTDVPTCSLHDTLADILDRVRRANWDRAIVVNDWHVVLGLIDESRLTRDPKSTAEATMENGPSTYRENVPLADIADQLRENAKGPALISTRLGVLVGVVTRPRAERLLREAAGKERP